MIPDAGMFDSDTENCRTRRQDKGSGQGKRRTFGPSRIVLVIFLALKLFFPLYVQSDENKPSPNGISGDTVLVLTAEEENWLKDHRVMRVAGPKAFPPFHFFDMDGTLKGIASDYLDLVFRQLNITADIQKNLPWPEVLQKAKAREIDLIACSAKTRDREGYLLFSKPYMSFPLVIITRKDAPFVGGLDDLQGKKVALVQGVSTGEWLERDRIQMIPVRVGTPLEGLTAVSTGKADAHIENLAAAVYLMEFHGLSNLKIAGPTPYGNYELYIAVRNDWPELIPIINKALETVSVNDQTAIREKWLSVNYDHGIHAWTVAVWIFCVVGLALVGLTGFFLWNRSLRREILERKTAEAALAKQESTLRSLFLAAPTGIGMTRERIITDANDRLVQMTGYSRDELMGKDARMLYPTDRDYEYVGREKYRKIAEMGTGTVETFWRRKDGKIIDVILSSTPLNREDLSEGVTFTALDITDRNRARQELMQSERRYRGIVEDQTELILRVDDRKSITFVNNAFCRFFEMGREELENRPLAEVLPQEIQGLFILAGDGLTADAPVKSYDSEGRNRSGKPFWIHWSMRRLFDDSGSPTEVQAVGQDMTERRHLEDRLRQSSKMEAIGTLSGGIAHDFNNILGIIMGNAELAMVNLSEDAKVHRFIKEVLTASLRARDLVGQLLAFSRKTESKKKPVDMAGIVTESLKMLRATIPASVEFKTVLAGDLPQVMADTTQIHQVMINLCTNAADAMVLEGGLIAIRLERVFLDNGTDHPDLPEDDYVRLTVTDTGHGMSQDILDRIFDPYFTTKAVGKGTGLGLSVTHGIVKNHGGSIRVTSRKGKGTAVEVLLPVLKTRVHQAPDAVRLIAEGRERILFVDDEEALVTLFKHRLQKLGYTVEGSTDPVWALNLIKADPGCIDLLITDMTMPKLTGDRLVTEARRLHPDLPAILCTGFSETMSEETARGLGINRYLEKPVETAVLAEAIREVLDGGSKGQ
ncbi:MAG: transporter substrate-binding domain-containing protein [Pseudomonadota bacterium]